MSKAWWSKGYYSGYWGSSGKDKDDDYDDDSSSTSSWDWRTAYKSRYKSSLGYSSSRLSETISYSSSTGYYSGWKSTGDDFEADRILLEKAYKASRDLVIILDLPFKISIQLSSMGDELEYGYTRKLFVPTAVLDEKDKYSESERINICSGLSIHEAAHLKYTEASVLQSFMNTLSDRLTICDDKIETAMEAAFIKGLINIIEDERIESNLLLERPGYTELIDVAKSYQYRKFIESEKSMSGKVTAFLNNLFRMIRYPEGIEDKVLEEYSDTYEKIRDILNPLPESTKESCIAGYKIYKVIKALFNDLGLNLKNLSSEFKIIGNFSAGYSDCLYGSDIDLGKTPDEKLVTDIIKNGRYSESIVAKLVVGSAEKVENNTYFEKIKGDKFKYDTIAKRVSKYVPAIKKVLKNTDRNYEFNIYGCRNGLLDTSKLAEAYQGVPHVYIRRGVVTTSNSAVCLLIDESGSMHSKDKWATARDAAILINEALKGTNTEFYSYGHTGDTITYGSTELKIYAEGSSKMSPWALSEVRARRENRDGTAILETAKRIRKRTNVPVLMFVLSDGCPCAYNYYGASAAAHVRECVKKVEAMGFTVVQVTIDTMNDDVCKKMFTNVIHLEKDLSAFPRVLGKIVKKAVLENKKTTVTA